MSPMTKTTISVALMLAVLTTEAPSAKAITLQVLCSQPNVIRSVLQFSRKLRFLAIAQDLKPNIAYFVDTVEDSSANLSCIYTLTAGQAYDFGRYKATFITPKYAQLKIISLTPIDLEVDLLPDILRIPGGCEARIVRSGILSNAKSLAACTAGDQNAN